MNWQKKITRIRDHKGQSLVEMAMVCMIFFFLLFGILEFGRALYYYNTIVQNTRAAARWAVVNVLDNSDAADITTTQNIVCMVAQSVQERPYCQA